MTLPQSALQVQAVVDNPKDGKVDKIPSGETMDFNYGTVTTNEGTVNNNLDGKVETNMIGHVENCIVDNMEGGTAANCDNIASMTGGEAINCTIAKMIDGTAIDSTIIKMTGGTARGENTEIREYVGGYIDNSIPILNIANYNTVKDDIKWVPAGGGSNTQITQEIIERSNPFVNCLQTTTGQISGAKEGAIVTLDLGDFNVLTLPVMKQMEKRRDLTIQMKYIYDGKKYEVIFPAGMPIKYQDEIRYYGPLKLTDMANRDGGICSITE